MAATRSTNAFQAHPSARDLRALLDDAQAGNGARVSVYLGAPDQPGFAEQQAIPKRWKAAIREVRAALEARGEERTAEIIAHLERQNVEADSTPGGAWTIAAFATAEELRGAVVAERLDDRVEVGERFALLPLLWAMHREAPYRLLVVSTASVRLFEGQGAALEPRDAPEVPSNLVDALGAELEKAEDHQHHTDGMRGRSIFHGHGGASRESEVDAKRFRLVLARAITDVWGGRHDPLFVMADRALLGELLQDIDDPHLVDEGVEGNFDDASSHELRAAVLPVLRRFVERRDEREIAAYQDGARGPIVKHLRGALEAAEQGRVQKVWIRNDGVAAAEDGQVEHLLALVLRHGGAIGVVEPTRLPGDAELLCALRG